MTVLEILEAKYTKDRTEYTIKFKPVPGKKLSSLTKEDITITSVSDGSKEDYEVINYTYSNKAGGSITFKTTKDPITAEIMVKFKDIEDEFSIETKEKTEEATQEAPKAPESTPKSGTEEEKKETKLETQTESQPASTETKLEEEKVEFGRQEVTEEEIKFAHPVINRFYGQQEVKKQFKPRAYELYFKEDYETSGVPYAYEANLLIGHFEQGDFIMREGNEFIMYTGEGPIHANIFMMVRNMSREEFNEYFHVTISPDYHKTYTFRVKKEHPDAVTKPFKLELGFYKLDDLAKLEDFTIELSPVDHSLKLPKITNNRKQTLDVYELPAKSSNFGDTIMNILVEKNEDYFELVKWSAEGYSFLIPFRNPIVIKYVTCNPLEAPNRAKKYIGFVQIRTKFPGEVTIVWTVKGKNGAVADVRQKIKVTGTPSPTDGMTPDEIVEWTIYGHTAEERDKWFCYRSLNRKVTVTGDPYVLNKFEMPKWQHRSLYRPQENVIYTDCIRLKDFFDKYPDEKVGIISYYWIPMGLTSKQFIDFLSTHKSGEGKEYYIRPPYYRTWEEYQYGKKNEIDYKKMAEEMHW
jgi:hypothetical protein